MYPRSKEPNSSPPRKGSKVKDVKDGDSKAEKPRSRSRSAGKRGRSATPPPTKIHIGR